jgi:glycosyltransferase involved in cell wall biosynthesis
VASRLGYEVVLPVYGVATYFDAAAGERHLSERFSLLYGGSIEHGTGQDLFLESIDRIATTKPDLALDIFITGRYPNDVFEAFAADIESRTSIRVFLHGELSTERYWDLLRKIDVGLCLKLPSDSIGQTTFPSKVIEYAAFGVLVCSTPVSDVPLIFSSDTAILMKTEDPEELSQRLIDAAGDRTLTSRKARAGREMVMQKFTSEIVGARLKEFLFG